MAPLLKGLDFRPGKLLLDLLQLWYPLLGQLILGPHLVHINSVTTPFHSLSVYIGFLSYSALLYLLLQSLQLSPVWAFSTTFLELIP